MYRIRTGLLLAFLILSFAGCSKQAEDTAAVSAPPAPLASDPVRNLLLICIDTVRADTFYTLGELRPDRLNTWQERALTFTQAHSPAPWTVPALASAFSGLWPVQHGAGLIPGTKRVSLSHNPPSLMRRSVRTVAGAARRAGIDTNVVSASGWTSEAINGVGINRGFVEFHNFAPSLEELGDIYWEPMVEKWSELITAQGEDERALNFVHLMEAHNWHLVPDAELDARIATFEEDQLAMYRSTAPAQACDDEASLMCRRYVVYAHAVGVMRNVIAEMLDILEARGQLKDTAVVVFSDHGEEFNDHLGDSRVPTEHHQNPFFGHGQSLYQELLHVPLLVWHPQHEGRTVDTPVSLVDIGSSAAHWLALRLHARDSEGKLLHEQTNDSEPGRVLYASHISYGEKQFAARQGADKSIWYVGSDRTDYYDLVKDPDELHSVPSNDLVLKFDRFFLEYDQMKREDKSESAKFTDEQLKGLQSIGYLQGVDDAEAEDD